MKTPTEQCYDIVTLPMEDVIRKIKSHDLNVEFIRSQDHIALYKGKGSGRILSAWEAISRYPKKIFEDILKNGVAAIGGHDEPSRTIRERRVEMLQSELELAQQAGISVDDVKRAENPNIDTDIHILEKIFVALGLDDTTLSFAKWCDAPSPPVFCLKKKMSSDFEIDFGKKDIFLFSDSAWINLTQVRLLSWLGGQQKLENFPRSSLYFNNSKRPFELGYELAQKTRSILNISTNEPIHNLQILCESHLGITCIERPLPANIAGLAVAHGNSRYMIINTNGNNINPLVRRVTIAHELAHILWDPDDVFSSIRPDSYDEIHKFKRKKHIRRVRKVEEFRVNENAVEARARAFSIEFLLPHSACPTHVAPNDVEKTIREYMVKYGTSFSSTKWHMINKGLFDEEQVNECYIEPHPKNDWNSEDVYYEEFPFSSTPYARRERFAYLTARAFKEGFLSADTAAVYLNTTPDIFKNNLNCLLEISANIETICRVTV